MLKGNDGKLVTSLDEQDRILKEVWDPLWLKHCGNETWAAAKEQFVNRLPQSVLQLGKIKVHHIRKALKRMRAAASLGADLWGVDELRALPDTVLQHLADVLSAMESDGRGEWPQELLQAFVALIPKTENDPSPIKQRPSP